MSTYVVLAALCECGHPGSDHESNEGGCVYGWDDWQALDDEERAADACECERYRHGSDLVA